MRRLWPYLAVIVLGIGLDQWIKMLVEQHLPLQEAVAILPFFALYRTYNTGVAFSMFDWAHGWGLVILSLVVICFVLYLAWRTTPGQILARLGFALIVSGAIGNIIDRVMLGHVVDYLLFHTPVWSFAVFNLADAFITVGAALVIADEFFGWGRTGEANKQDG